ncbi:DUF397 domain-containing protein [Actinoalloteichus hymeniacidonis]|uniref:DUF397 family protein n=1 Tax=Actinoalloteichus hymeniacidonis TaxID=340345 RepID=A0AAC9HQ21_9PSEU|nr:DUF397 domain-containing protein [Actinoalloteichus hymeniacidonis]AOS63310.1 putative DUF397 family protein [Actinoalloteichus hymeniacidonis]MBB5908651.1 hypothetical protein [Actinoalloteichus hymeniacidonis]
MRTENPDSLKWRKSSFSGGGGTGGGNCVEAAALPDGRIAIRNSKNPDDGTAYFTRTEIHAWLQGIKAGEFDDLA